jgi:hypothetical protein
VAGSGDQEKEIASWEAGSGVREIEERRRGAMGASPMLGEFVAEGTCTSTLQAPRRMSNKSDSLARTSAVLVLVLATTSQPPAAVASSSTKRWIRVHLPTKHGWRRFTAPGHTPYPGTGYACGWLSARHSLRAPKAAFNFFIHILLWAMCEGKVQL